MNWELHSTLELLLRLPTSSWYFLLSSSSWYILKVICHINSVKLKGAMRGLIQQFSAWEAIRPLGHHLLRNYLLIFVWEPYWTNCLICCLASKGSWVRARTRASVFRDEKFTISSTVNVKILRNPCEKGCVLKKGNSTYEVFNSHWTDTGRRFPTVQCIYDDW